MVRFGDEDGVGDGEETNGKTVGLEGGGVAAEEHDVDPEEDGDGDAKGKAAEAEEEQVQHGTCVVLCGCRWVSLLSLLTRREGTVQCSSKRERCLRRGVQGRGARLGR